MNLPANYAAISEDELTYVDGGSFTLPSLFDVANVAITVAGALNTLSVGGTVIGALSSGSTITDIIAGSIESAKTASSAELLTTGIKFAASVWSTVSIGNFVANKLNELSKSEEQ
jgi:hypothetical protein